MLPRDMKQLEKIREECRTMVLRRATTSAGASVVPLPGMDIAVDVGLLIQLLPAINKKFGLTPDQIDKLDPERRALIYAIIKKAGTKFVGTVITKQLIVATLKKVGVRMTAKQAAKFVPIAGQIASAVLGFGAMMYVGTSHVDDCYEIAKSILDADPV